LVDEAFNGYSSKKETQQPPPAPEPKKDEPVAERPAEKRQPRGEDLLSLACVDLGKVALEKIVAAITIDTDVTVEQIQDRVLYRVSGGNPSVLIGKRGQNLEAIQYLIDKIVNKTNERRIRVQVDAAGYLEKRKENLIRLAERMAEKTHKTGKPSTVGPMNAQDRRVVHITLKNDRGVRTQSVGDGYYRKLMIFPKKSTAPQKKKYGETVVADNSRA
jgi:spoIIIJ-associated protein